jgi:hypothetical protein
MPTPRVLSLKVAKTPRRGIIAYGIVQSRSRANRVNHTVVIARRGTNCSCEDQIFNRPRGGCAHIRQFRKKLAQRRAA